MRQQGVGRWRPALLFAFLPALLALMLLVLFNTSVQAQTPSPTFSPDQVTTPITLPVAAFGADSFGQNCAPCHGMNGKGDGPTAASLTFSPTVFADADTMWAVSPAQMFFTAKFGRIERLMPPWQSRLSDDEIWQTIMYAWSLHTSPTFVAGGQTLYTQNCAGCHGDKGKGDGPEAQGKLPDFTDLSYATSKSQADWLAGWQSAHPEIGKDWTAQEQRQVLEYIRTFSYVPAWQSGYQPGPGVVHGKVIMGTAGEVLTPGITVTLQAYAHFTLAETFTTTIDAGGNFTFTNLSVAPNFSYLAAAKWANIRYTSALIQITQDAPKVETTVTLYDTTTKAPAIRINRTEWIIDDQPGSVMVVQLYYFGADGDRTYLGAPPEGLPISATVGIKVPDGAEQVTFDGGELGVRFQQVGNRYYDTSPLMPGQGTNQIVVRYLMPYKGTSLTFSQPFLYPNDQVILLIAQLPQLQATVTPQGGAPWEVADKQDLQGRSYNIYQEASLPATSIQVELTGLLASDSADPRDDTGAIVSPPAAVFAPWMAWSIGGLSFLMLASVMFWTWRSGRVQISDSPPDLQKEMDDLARSIAQLDDRHALGQLDDDRWQLRRGQLKARLIEVAQRLQTAIAAAE